MLTNIHISPAKDNFCTERGKAIKPQIVIDYNQHMGYVGKCDIMANNSSISRHTFKWTKKIVFYVKNPTVLNSYIPHSSCGGKKISHRDFRYSLMRNVVAHAGPEQRLPRTLGRTTNVESQVARLEVCGRKHWPVPSETQLSCRVCKARGVTQKVFVKCSKCEVGLCVKKRVLRVTAQRRSSDTTSFRKPRN